MGYTTLSIREDDKAFFDSLHMKYCAKHKKMNAVDFFKVLLRTMEVEINDSGKNRQAR